MLSLSTGLHFAFPPLTKAKPCRAVAISTNWSKTASGRCNFNNNNLVKIQDDIPYHIIFDHGLLIIILYIIEVINNTRWMRQTSRPLQLHNIKCIPG